jgi:hypothetical protein
MQNTGNPCICVASKLAKLTLGPNRPHYKDRGRQVAKPQCIKVSIFQETRWAQDYFAQWRTKIGGRHVGLDFYDLLIEALRTPPMSDKAMFHQQFRNEGCATLSSCPFWDSCLGPEVAQVLKILTAYTLRMTLYSY